MYKLLVETKEFFDRINGNSYQTAKIVNLSTGEITIITPEYGDIRQNVVEHITNKLSIVYDIFDVNRYVYWCDINRVTGFKHLTWS